MLRVLLFTLIYFTSSIAFCQKLRYESNTTHQDLIRNLKIKTAASYVYFIKKDGSPDSLLSTVTNYDSLGNMIEHRTYRGGRTWSKAWYNYENGRLVSKGESVPEVKDTLLYEYTYDSIQHKTIEKAYSFKGLHSTVREYFYEGNKLTRVLARHDEEKQKPESVFEYHSDGYIKKTISYTGKTSETKLYVYDDMERSVTVLILEGNSKKGKNDRELFYNEKGQLIKERIILTTKSFNNGKPGVEYVSGNLYYEYVYNADGTLYEKRIIRDNKIINYIRYYYY